MHALCEVCPSERIPYVTRTVCKSTLLLHTSGPYGVLLCVPLSIFWSTAPYIG